jgi:hypothetical protein
MYAASWNSLWNGKDAVYVGGMGGCAVSAFADE